MNKKLSRIAAIALSAAMVTSAFAMSTATAFAADRPTETIAATLDMVQASKTIIKVNNSGVAFALPQKANFDLANAKVNGTTKDLGTLTPEITNVTKSGDSVAYDSTKLASTPLTAVKTGDTTFTYTVKLPDTANNKEYVANVTSTVKVIPSNALVVTPAATAEEAGQDLSGVFTVSNGAQNDGGFKLISLGVNTATYESATAANYIGAGATPTYAWSTSNAGVLAVAQNSTKGYIAGYKANAAGTASVSATVTGDDNRQILPLAVTVKDNTTITASAATDVTIAADPYDASKTYITSDVDGKVTKTDVSNKDITLDATNMTGLTISSGAKVGKITIKKAPATFVALKVNGTTGDITFDKDTSSAAAPVTAIGKGAVTGTVDLSNVAPGTTTVSLTGTDDKDITVAGIKLPTTKALAVVNTTSKSNKINLGSVIADTVTVNGLDTNAATALTKNDVSKYSQVTINTLSATDTKLTQGVALTATDVALKVSTTGKLYSVTTASTVASDVTVGTKAIIATLTSVKPQDTFNFTAGADINAAVTDATGSLKTVIAAPANSLRIGGNTTGEVAVKLLGSFKAGDTWVTTDAKANVNLATAFAANMITPANFDSADVDAAKATSAGFEYYVSGKTVTGVAMDKTDVTLGLDDTATLTVNNQPAGAADYAKYDVQWTTSNPDFVTVDASGKTATIKAIKYADLKAQDADNGATISATYYAYDSYGVKHPIGTANTKVTVVAKTAPVLTTTVTDLDGKVQTVTADTVIKMTQSTYNTVKFAANKAGIANINYITANDKVAQTGTASAWNGTAGEYTIYANGKVGDKVGVFANGVKVFQIEIVDRPFECDTTLDLDGVKAPALTVGQKYSFKIRKANPAIKDFTFLTANGSAVASWGFVKNADGTVTATIKALKATDKIGVYVKINNVTYKVFAAAVK